MFIWFSFKKKFVDVLLYGCFVLVGEVLEFVLLDGIKCGWCGDFDVFYCVYYLWLWCFLL